MRSGTLAEQSELQKMLETERTKSERLAQQVEDLKTQLAAANDRVRAESETRRDCADMLKRKLVDAVAETDQASTAKSHPLHRGTPASWGNSGLSSRLPPGPGSIPIKSPPRLKGEKRLYPGWKKRRKT